jgi:branched-chain amino acid transport system ATP-binding protein
MGCSTLKETGALDGRNAVVLEIRGVEKRFGGLSVLSGVSFEVAAGTILGLIGPNGAGKTTLFNILTGFVSANAGTVQFNSEYITRLPAERRAMLGIARTFQVVKPFSGLSVLENVMVGAFAIEKRVGPARQRAVAALERVGLGAAGGLPPSSLTLPDRKRMELARCIAMQPKLLLLDEVMCGLNPTEMADMIALIRSTKEEGITLIVVEHIMDVIVELAEDVIVLASGRVIARGTPSVVLKDEQVIEAYLGEAYDALH